MQEMFVLSLIEIGQMFHFKRFFPIYKCKNSFPSCVLHLDPRDLICTSLILHYVRKLSCKYSLFWVSGSQGKISNDLAKCLHFYDYLPLRGPGPLFEQFKIPFT
jgi:hypothetical protein